MTPKELAERINGRQYRNEMDSELRELAKESGLVVVYGASDDLCELDGSIYDEAGCYGGGTLNFKRSGFFNIPDEHLEVLEQYPASVLRAVNEGVAEFEANWCPEGVEGSPSWTYTVPFPHETFRIMEDDDLYCIGFVFLIDDAFEVSP